MSFLRHARMGAALAIALVILLGGDARATGTVPEEDPTAPPPVPSVRRTAFKYLVSYSTIPKSGKKFDLWVPLPARNDNQKLSDLLVQVPGGGSFETEAVHGNNIYHGQSGPRGGVPYNFNLRFVVERREVRNQDLESDTGVPPAPPANLADYVKATRMIPLDRKVTSLSKKVTGKSKDVVQRARAIYDWVVDNLALSPGGTDAWGKGDLKAVLSAEHGNSLDVSTTFVGLARAAEIPARTVIGFKLPESQTTGILTGYHAWAEFWAPGRGWIPVDPALAMQRPSRRPYYFGSLDQHRIRISAGRDVILAPPQAGDPLNYLLYPYAELDGAPLGGSVYRFSFDVAPDPPAAVSGGM